MPITVNCQPAAADGDPAVGTCTVAALRGESGTTGNASDVSMAVPVFATDGHFSLRVFVDHSVVEVFAAGGRGAMTLRVYPQAADAVHVRLRGLAPAGTQVASVRAWQMGGAFAAQ